MKTCPQCILRYPDDSTFCFVDGATLQPAGDGMVGRTLGGLFVGEQRVAESAWAAVHRGRYRLIEGDCTIKLLKQPLSEDQQPRFIEAVKRARRYAHPNIAEIWSGGIAAGHLGFVVGPAQEVRSLGELVGRGPLGFERAMGITVQILRALGRIHDFGGTHGDLRPSNVLVDSAGRAQVVDVGLGRSLHRDLWEQTAEGFGALGYLAPELKAGEACTPEQAEGGNRASAAGDLYALGVLVFQMLTQKLPVVAPNVEQLRARLSETPSEPPSASLTGVPTEVAAWIEELLERFPERRPPSAHQALDELCAICEKLPLPVPLLPAPKPPAPVPSPAPLAGLFARWDRWSALFQKMVELGFPTGAPPQTRNALDTIRGKVQDLGALGKKAQSHHGVLGDVHQRAWEGRQRIAEQMVEFTVQIRAVHQEVRPLQLAAARHGAEADAYPPRLLECHRDVIRWEGRSGFREPYPDLAQAYRRMAELVDQWWAVRCEQRRCDAEAKEREEQLAQVRAQLDELRTALRIHESNVDAEIEACERSIGELVTELDELEPALLDMATRMTAPLRAKPELGVCFRELLAK
jgi:serine/threonine protein kinase